MMLESLHSYDHRTLTIRATSDSPVSGHASTKRSWGRDEERPPE